MHRSTSESRQVHFERWEPHQTGSWRFLRTRFVGCLAFTEKMRQAERVAELRGTTNFEGVHHVVDPANPQLVTRDGQEIGFVACRRTKKQISAVLRPPSRNQVSVGSSTSRCNWGVQLGSFECRYLWRIHQHTRALNLTITFVGVSRGIASYQGFWKAVRNGFRNHPQ